VLVVVAGPVVLEVAQDQQLAPLNPKEEEEEEEQL
jgi:hypothetical protein